jgi:F-type H+-transporting ATPase subunit epsilon
MADRLRLRVYSPEQELVDADVLEVTAPGVQGEIGVLPDHAALVTMLDAGTLSYKDGARTVRFAIGGGLAEVRDNVMTVLADSAQPAD